MLFLMNDRVLDLGEPDLCLIGILGSAGLTHDRLRPRDVVEMGRLVWFRVGFGREPAHQVRLAIAALAAMKLQANAAMVVTPRGARGPGEVLAKFAFAPVEMLERLHRMQADGVPPGRLVEDAFWRSAA